MWYNKFIEESIACGYEFSSFYIYMGDCQHCYEGLCWVASYRCLMYRMLVQGIFMRWSRSSSSTCLSEGGRFLWLARTCARLCDIWGEWTIECLEVGIETDYFSNYTLGNILLSWNPFLCRRCVLMGFFYMPLYFFIFFLSKSCWSYILKAINTNTRLTWKPKNRKKNHNILVLLFF